MLSFFSVLGCGISAAAASCSQQSTNSSNKSVNNINNNNNQQVANGTTTSALVENHSSRSPTVIRTLASASLASSASTASAASAASNIRYFIKGHWQLFGCMVQRLKSSLPERMYLPLRQWGTGNVYLLLLSSWKVNIAVTGLYIRSGPLL